MKLKFNNNEAINVLDASTADEVFADCASVEAMELMRESMNREALAEFQYLTDDGKVFGRYQNRELERVSYIVKEGIYHATFHLRKLSETELRLEALEKEQELQNGAIDELAEIVGGEA